MKTFAARIRDLRAIALALLIFAASAPLAAESLRFGAMPFLPPERMTSEFGGYAAWIGAEIGADVSFVTFENFDAFAKAIESGDVDIAWVGPLDVQRALDAGYTTLVRTNRDFSAIIVTDKQTITGIQDLQNRSIGKTRPDASTTRLANRALLLEGLRGRVTTYHFGEHERCFEAMLSDKVAACVTHDVPASLFQRARNVQFRTIYETAAIPSSAIAIHDHVPAAIRDSIIRSLTAMNTTEYGRQLLAESGIGDGWIATTADAYRTLSVTSAQSSALPSGRREKSPVTY